MVIMVVSMLPSVSTDMQDTLSLLCHRRELIDSKWKTLQRTTQNISWSRLKKITLLFWIVKVKPNIKSHINY